MNLKGKLSQTGSLKGKLQARGSLRGKLSFASGEYPHYHGATEVTPTNYTQVLYTGGNVVADNIIINPIPHNYGLITWNGAYITVS